MEKTGHYDKDGKWVDETPQAKIRNRLTPFWTLSTIAATKDLTDPEIAELVTELAKQCEGLKKEIIALLEESERK